MRYDRPHKTKSVGTNAVLNSAKTVLSIIFPLITYPYAARILQVENMGKIDFVGSVVSYFVLFAGLGIATYATREGAAVRNDPDALTRFSNQVFSINLISSLISACALLAIIFFVPSLHDYRALMLVKGITIFGNLIGVLWVYSIFEDYLYITVRSLVVHIVALILMFAFVRDKEDYIIYAGTSVVANVGANIFNFIHARKYLRLKITCNVDFKQHLKPILVLFVTALNTTIYVNSDKTLLGIICGDYSVGLYSTAVNVYSVLKQVFAAAILVLLPRTANQVANNNLEKYKSLINKALKMILTILVPAVAGLIITSKEIVLIIAGKTYFEAFAALRILSVSLLFAVLATFMVNVVLLPNKYEKINLKGTAISAALNVILNLFILKQFKQNGAAFTTLVAEFFVFFYLYFSSKRFIKLNLDYKFLSSVVAGVVIILAVGFVCDKLAVNVFIGLIIKIILSVIAYLTVMLISKNEGYMYLNKMLKDKLGLRQKSSN